MLTGSAVLDDAAAAPGQTLVTTTEDADGCLVVCISELACTVGAIDTGICGEIGDAGLALCIIAVAALGTKFCAGDRIGLASEIGSEIKEAATPS